MSLRRIYECLEFFIIDFLKSEHYISLNWCFFFFMYLQQVLNFPYLIYLDNGFIFDRCTFYLRFFVFIYKHSCPLVIFLYGFHDNCINDHLYICNYNRCHYNDRWMFFMQCLVSSTYILHIHKCSYKFFWLLKLVITEIITNMSVIVNIQNN